MENQYREVYFHEYCKKCQYEKFPETKLPCNECLAEFMNTESHKPVHFREKNPDRGSVEYVETLTKEEQAYINAISHLFET